MAESVITKLLKNDREKVSEHAAQLVETSEYKAQVALGKLVDQLRDHPGEQWDLLRQAYPTTIEALREAMVRKGYKEEVIMYADDHKELQQKPTL